MQEKSRGIVVAEDDDAVHRFLQTLFRQARGTVHRAVRASELEPLVRSVRPERILVDVHLRDGTSFDAVRRIRRMPEAAGVPIAAMSALETPEIRSQALACGCTIFLPKPFPLDSLLAWVGIDPEKPFPGYGTSCNSAAIPCI